MKQTRNKRETLLGRCKDCKHSEVYTERLYYPDPLKKTVNRKCNLLQESDDLEPRLDNEMGYTCVTHIDVDDNFGCIKCEKR